MSGKAKRDFQVGDRVKYSKKGMNTPLTAYSPRTVFTPRVGEVKAIVYKEDAKGYKRKWLEVLWDGTPRPSLHASQRLIFEKEDIEM